MQLVYPLTNDECGAQGWGEQGEVWMTVGDCRTEKSTGTSVGKGSFCVINQYKTKQCKQKDAWTYVLPSDHGGVLLDSRLQQPLQNGPFPHGGGDGAALSEVGRLEGSKPHSLWTPCSSSSQDRLLLTCLSSSTPRPLWLCQSPSPGPVPLCLPSWLKRGSKLITPPQLLSSLSLSALSLLLPLSSPCAVMLVLTLPHHSVLRYGICYSSPHDSHDLPSFPLSSLLLHALSSASPAAPAFVLHPTPRALLVLYLRRLPSVLLCARPCIV